MENEITYAAIRTDDGESRYFEIFRMVNDNPVGEALATFNIDAIDSIGLQAANLAIAMVEQLENLSAFVRAVG